MNRLRIAGLAAGVLLVLAASFAATARADGPVPGPNRAYMDTTCSPCKDFFRYANGHWLDTAEIPASYPIIGASREIADRNQEALREVLEGAQARAATEEDPTIKKLGQLYAVLMDSTRADAEGAKPIRPDLDRIAAIDSPEKLRAEFARSAVTGLGAGPFGGGGLPFRLEPEVDPKQSDRVIPQIRQGGLGLPDREYYFRGDPRSETLRQDYVAYMSGLFQLLGDSQEAAEKKAADVMKLETALAESSLAPVQMRDPHALYHKMSVKELGALAPHIDWGAYFTAAGLPAVASPEAMLDVSMPSFMRQVDALLQTTPMETWRAYLQWNYTRARAPWLGQKFFDRSFAFTGKLLGLREPQPRWKRASQAVDGSMGEALGKAYVEKYFPPSSKARMMELVNNLLATYRERIGKLDWMSDATKKQAIVKLAAITKKIGYPDKWRDYSRLAIDPSLAAVENLNRAQEFQRRFELGLIGKPPDRTLWGMSPPTVNAYYNPPFNEIVFPAGILQPPQFDPRADDAVNYGAIGMVIGHEITHGFDDEGRQYDADGNLRDWWTAEDGARFDERAQKVVQQYNAYVSTDTLHINGKLTLGENLADQGGLTLAYYAWRRSLKGKEPPVIDGFTGDQRFFLGFAQAWRRKIRPEMVRLMTFSDPHSPAEWRVKGVVVNMPEFAKAFGCAAADAMAQGNGERVW